TIRAISRGGTHSCRLASGGGSRLRKNGRTIAEPRTRSGRCAMGGDDAHARRPCRRATRRPDFSVPRLAQSPGLFRNSWTCDDQTHHYVHWLNRLENLEIGLALCVKVNIKRPLAEQTRNERSDQVKIKHGIILYSSEFRGRCWPSQY